jgi:predicted transcriptional regulator
MESSLYALCREFDQFHNQMETLKKINENICSFNQIFSSLLWGIRLVSKEFEISDNLPDNCFQSDQNNNTQSQKVIIDPPTSKDSESIAVNRIMNNLPKDFRGSEDIVQIETIIRYLYRNQEGKYMMSIMTDCSVDKQRIVKILNSLVKNGDLIKLSRKGAFYQLNPKVYRLSE